MSLTITIPGAVEATIGATAPAVLTVGVGTPGATGPAGPAGQGVPVGGTAGQFLTKIDGTNYNTDWTTLNLSAYAVKANNLSDLASASTARTNLGLGTMATATAANYSTTAVANTLYAPIAAGQPTSGTVGQVLTKNSGTNYDSSWATLIPGDRYLTTSTTSNTISNGAMTFTVGTGLSYSSQQDVVIAYDASNHMHAVVTSYNSGTGVLVVDVQHHTGSGTYAVWTVNVGGTTPLQSVYWGEILGTLGDQSDLATALNAKLETSTAASTYAALAGATFTGEVATPASTTSTAGLSIAPGVAPSAPQNGEVWNTGSDLQVRLGGVTETLAEQSWVTGLGYITSSALTPYAPLAGATFTGLVTTLAPTTATAGLNIPHGVAPTSPVNGDVWTTTSGVFARINAGTQQLMSLGNTQTVSGSITFSNASQTLGNSTAASTVNVGTGATLTATTKAVNIGTAGVSGSTTNIIVGPVLGASTTSIGGTTAASTLNLATGATLTATTKAVNIGTSGVAGSTTNIAIGSTTGTSTTTLQGNVTASGITLDLGNSTAASTVSIGSGATTTGLTKVVNIATNGATGSTTTLNLGSAQSPGGILNIKIGETTGTTTTNVYGSFILNSGGTTTTAAADTNSTAIASTAYVVGQAGSATPIVDGTAAVGTSLRYARQDHVHPTDTSRAALASPTFTGTPLSTTAAVDTNTTQIATTAFVVGQASSTAPVIDGTATVGTSLKYARADHVHPTDTSRAALASPTFTGTPLSTTAAVDTNTTQIATTAYVVGQGYLKSATASSTYAPLASPALTGTPTAPTATLGTNTTQVATTAFVLANAGAGAVTSVAGRTGAVVLSNTDISGLGTMSTATAANYSTTTVANGLYYPLSGNPSSFLVAADIAGKANIASPSLTGTPLSTTAAVDTNTTQIATTAFVVGQAASATPLVDGTAAVGTSTRYARADHVHPTDTTRAPLASPTFSGTPSLPTGTTAVTQTAGNNTTAVATTAFVTAAIPAFATTAQLLAGTSSTTGVNPLLLRYAMSNPGYTAYSSLIGNYSSYTSGTAATSVYSDYFCPYITVANGKVAICPSSTANVNSFQSRGVNELLLDWTKPMWFSFRVRSSALGDANTVMRVTVGKITSTFGDLATAGFGVKWTGGTAGAFTLLAHNGTTLTTSASAVTVSNTTYFASTTAAADFLVYSDGAGNITLYCNNIQVATATGGPSTGTALQPRFAFETDNTTSTSGTCAPIYNGIRSMFAY